MAMANSQHPRQALQQQHARLLETLTQIRHFQTEFADLDTRTEALNGLSDVLHSITANEAGFRYLNTLLTDIRDGAFPELKSEAQTLESILVELAQSIDQAERLTVEAKSRLAPELRSDVLSQKMRSAYANRQR